MQETATARDITLDTPERLVTWLRPGLAASLRFNIDTENLGIIALNTRRRPIGFEIISNGSLDTLLVHPREVFKPAILLNAAAIVLFHNHPSGDPTPSEADIKITQELIRASQLIKIELLDHVILGTTAHDRPKDWSSLREMGHFYSTTFGS